jgi:hypothetical protein
VILALAHFGWITVTDRTILPPRLSAELSSPLGPVAGRARYPVIGTTGPALEEQFYLTWPLLMFLFARKARRNVEGFIVIAPLFVGDLFSCAGFGPQIGMMFHTALDSVAAGVLLGS